MCTIHTNSLHSAVCPDGVFEYPACFLQKPTIFLLLPGAELPLVESFGLLNDLFPFPSILDAGYPVLDLQLANILFDVILPSVLGSSL
jgi:hypothetical protein